MNQQNIDWDLVIEPKKSLFDLQLNQLFKYKELIFLFTKRDFVSTYKQTLLGPLWFFLQPILTTFTFVIIFGNIAKISTDGVPQVLFYLSGITIWNYFSDCLIKTSNTFVANQGLFGKVYFPRLIVPLSVILTNLFKLGIQLILFFAFWIYYFFFTSEQIHPNITILFLPLLILIMAVLGLGLGMIISAMTTKYKDLSFLVSFGVQLLMYATPIVYPASIVPEKYRTLLFLNPMTSIIETFKYSMLGIGSFNIYWLLYSLIFSFLILLIGIIIFNKVEKSFIDTV